MDIQAALTAFGTPPSPTLVTVTGSSPGQRVKRAARAAGVFFAFAAGCVFLPGLHFVLVPTFLVLGIGAGVRRLQDAQIVTRVHGACPRCGLEQDFAAGNRPAPTWKVDCPACHNTLTLTLNAEGAGGSTSPA